jgi:hypothetical protein
MERQARRSNRRAKPALDNLVSLTPERLLDAQEIDALCPLFPAKTLDRDKTWPFFSLLRPHATATFVGRVNVGKLGMSKVVPEADCSGVPAEHDFRNHFVNSNLIM